MSEIREQTILDIVNILEEVKDISVTEAYEKLVTHPNIAIIDRGAKLPKCSYINRAMLRGWEYCGYKMLKEGWIKEVKE